MPLDGPIAPLVHVADSHGSDWSWSAGVIFGPDRSFGCSYSCMLVYVCVCVCVSLFCKLRAYLPVICKWTFEPLGLKSSHKYAKLLWILWLPYDMSLAFSLHVFFAVYLYGTNCEQYRGLLVQGRQNVTGDPVGRFSDFTSNTRESNCTNPGPEVRKKDIFLKIKWLKPRPPPGSLLQI